MKYILLAIEQVVKAYGLGFGMLIFGGCAAAAFLEITVKNGFSWVESKIADEKMKDIVLVLRIVAILVGSVTLTAKITEGVVDIWELPSRGFQMFVWWAWCYVAQYVFSMYGIKGFLEWREDHKAKKAQKKALEQEKEAQKPVLEAVPDRPYFRLRDKDGHIITDEYGREVYVDARGRKL